MRELRNRNINDLVHYLKKHKQGSFQGKNHSQCPVAGMYRDTMKANDVSVSSSAVSIKRQTYRLYGLPEDFRVFVQVFDQGVGRRNVSGEEALVIAEQVRDALREEYLAGCGR